MSALHYITDANGSRTSIIIPIHRLLELSEIIEELRRLEEITGSIKQGLREARSIEAGEQVGITAEDFLNEL